ncbi:hypothetical protein [Polynucleobacter sp. UK-Gri1-W3]|uniref:hypothetical protein n=1 Tax=Polynucleobacter sp. UK-Gri1-W3 TaxID=1819737 RepID=UPI001C0CFD08|nr:hypothetical protein [Polynucleobacter sp. UK-Gri1-W3]MBU3539178.1 hypothetical protein [Polynucleobacter sp. UK-Gri1-W3]
MRITANQKQEIANAILVKLDALANRRQVWQRDFYDKSNKALINTEDKISIPTLLLSMS